MRKNSFRLGQKPPSFYLGGFDERSFSLSASGEAYTTVGDGDFEIEVHIPVEFGTARRDLIERARSALTHIIEMDEAARASNPESEENEHLAVVSVYEFHTELEYFSTTVNTQWTEFFTPTSDGGWRHRGKFLPWMHRWYDKTPPSILAVDVAYAENGSAAAGVYFKDWAADSAQQTFSARIEGAPSSYEPGEFYKRELPVLMALLDQAPMPVSTIIVDGYVWLSGDGRPGLGARLHEALARRVPVIGVAKTRFHEDTWSKLVRRGESDAPLYVTAVGVDAGEAARRVAEMSGIGRIPLLLKQADGLARSELTA